VAKGLATAGIVSTTFAKSLEAYYYFKTRIRQLPVKSFDIVFKIKKYEDGDFKIEDYYIENMITFEE